MDGDRPTTRENDRLGFAPIADHLARAIVDQSAQDGLVFGIEGKWGSGKSTLINLTIEALKDYGDTAPEIVEFSPWLVGDRDSLLLSLFDELAKAAVKIDPVDAEEERPTLWQRAKRSFSNFWKLKQKERIKEQLGRQLKAFAALSVPLAMLAKTADELGVPTAKLVGRAFENLGNAANSFPNMGTPSKRKSDLVEALRLLSRRIVVFVDDLDRLEPREATEILRLIRAVADFPNVIYVLSYDPDVVAQTLTHAVQIKNGASFLEKIVQVSFRVPRPETFDLRRWFDGEVRAIFEIETGSADDRRKPVGQRLAQAIDVRGGRYLNTPRDVVRALNALRLHGLPVRELVDVPDMVWLQLVKIGNPALYDWVEKYLNEVAAIANGASISDAESQAFDRQLGEILKAESGDVNGDLFELERLLPGIDDGLMTRDEAGRRRVFNNLSNGINQFVADKRLGSPQHYRYYFAFSAPAGALSDEQVHVFTSTAERAPADAIAVFADLAKTNRPQGGSMAEVLIDRLVALSDRIPETSIPGIFASLAENMDDVALLSRDIDFGQPRAWESASRAVEVLLKRVNGEYRYSCIQTLFAKGRALGWLTSLLRREIFSHGHFGDRVEPEHQRLLTASEFATVLETMLGRYLSASAKQLLNVPNLMSLLYGWQQGSGTDEAKKWVEAQTAADAGLLAFLSRARGRVVSSADGVYYPLKRHDLERFLNYEDALQRVRHIESNADTQAADRELAKELLVAFDQGKSV